jgi:hypothetical protein
MNSNDLTPHLEDLHPHQLQQVLQPLRFSLLLMILTEEFLHSEKTNEENQYRNKFI